MLHDIIMGASSYNSGSLAAPIVENVFSTDRYAGTNAAKTITNGIDTSTFGGLIWIKGLTSAGYSHCLMDTVRGNGQYLRSDLGISGATPDYTNITSFNTNGFTLGTNTQTSFVRTNYSGEQTVAWTFRKSPKFFDVVSFSGNGAVQTINHALGQTPGMIICRRLDSGSSWFVYHIGLGNTKVSYLSTTEAAQTLSTAWDNTSPTLSTFTVGTSISVSGSTWIAYLFAHDPSAEGIIQCGSFTTSAGQDAQITNIGWEPQFVLAKSTSNIGDWMICDETRGFPTQPGGQSIIANSSTVSTTSGISILPNGFRHSGLNTSTDNIYVAIRIRNKIPTTGSEILQVINRTGNGSGATLSVGFSPDLVISKCRSNFVVPVFIDKIRGNYKVLNVNLNDVEYTDVSGLPVFVKNGITFGADGEYFTLNYNSYTYSTFLFKRAISIFDIFAYTGTGANQNIPHNLGVLPELWIVKCRNEPTRSWVVGSSLLSNTQILSLDSNSGVSTGGSTYWNSTFPGQYTFSVGSDNNVNQSTRNFVAYLFASKAGISKVGTYVGNGSSQTINCGFSTGARFIMIKRTDSAGDWFIWNTTSGIVAGNDPHISLNTSAAEVTVDDTIDPETSGFIVNQNLNVNVNVTSATYLYLAIA